MAMSAYINAGATISACGKYRYRLWREWRGSATKENWEWHFEDDGSPVVDGAGKPWGDPKSCVFVMLNPSTADGEQDDPTIRRCVAFAKALQYDRLEVINLFAYRATDPKALLALRHNDNPVGDGNRRAFDLAQDDAGIIIAAWGAHGSHLGQDEAALGWIGATEKVHALGLTKDGHPRHPLYLPASTKPFPWNGRRVTIHQTKGARLG